MYTGYYTSKFKNEKTLNHMYNLDSERVRVSFLCDAETIKYMKNKK